MIVNLLTMKSFYIDSNFDTVQIHDAKQMEPQQWWKPDGNDRMVNPDTGWILILEKVNGINISNWRFQSINDLTPKLCNIIDPGTNEAITLQPCVANGAKIVIKSNRDWTNEWYLKAVGDEKYKIIHAITGKVMDVQGGRRDTGTDVQVCDECGVQWQEWHWLKERQIFVNADSVKALDVYHGRIMEDRMKVHVWDINDTDAQKWTLQLIDE